MSSAVFSPLSACWLSHRSASLFSLTASFCPYLLPFNRLHFSLLTLPLVFFLPASCQSLSLLPFLSLNIFFSHYFLFVHPPYLFYFMFLQFSLHRSYFFLSLNLFLSSSFLCLSLLSLPFQSWYPPFSNHFPCLSLALATPLPSSCLSKAFASTHLLRGALFSEPYLSGVPSRWEDACFWKGSIVPLGEQGDSQL